MRRDDQSLAGIFRFPLIVASVTFAGLLCALMGDRMWDAGSWLLLLVPVLSTLLLWHNRQR